MDKGHNTGHEEGPSFKNDIEVMSDSNHQKTPLWRRVTSKIGKFWRPAPSIRLSLLLAILLLPCLALAASDGPKKTKKPDPNGHDIAVIIDNRETVHLPSSKEDVKALTKMLDRHMFADHIIRLERPSFAVICDIFGGCPSKANRPWPPLIEQIAHRGRSRLYVYYLGPGRIEGRQRQLLFDDGAGKESAYAVGWLHSQLQKSAPRSALVMMETSFAPFPLPCASDDPDLIDATMKSMQQNFARLMEGRTLPKGFAELSAALPAEAAHCDRFDFAVNDIERPLFTKFLLEGVAGGMADTAPSGDGDGTVELGELAAYTRLNIGRAVQFQWGRAQNVWQVGPESRALAKVMPRVSTFRENKIVTGIEETKEKPARQTVEVQPRPEPKPATRQDKPKVEKKPAPVDEDKVEKEEQTPPPHACDRDLQGEACLEFCADNPDDFRCPFIGVALCQGQPVSEACPCVNGDPRAACQDTGRWCRWSSAKLGPGAELAVALVGSSPESTCVWATRDESNLADNIWWDLFAPIGWRLIRPLFRTSVACAMACGQRARQQAVVPVEDEAPESELIATSLPTTAETQTNQQQPEPTDRPPRTDFERQICASSPPYIGLPRWMPGTLIVSEALRYASNCGPFPPGPRFERSLPPPVALVEAPPVPDPRYRWPSFGMPPPTVLPPITPTVIILPSFKPTENQIRWMQSALTVGNHNPGPIDGLIGKKTDAALRSWRANNGATQLDGELTEDEFIRIIREFGEKFDQTVPSTPLY